MRMAPGSCMKATMAESSPPPRVVDPSIAALGVRHFTHPLPPWPHSPADLPQPCGEGVGSWLSSLLRPLEVPVLSLLTVGVMTLP